MTDPGKVDGGPDLVRRRRWLIWIVIAVALVVIAVLALGKNLGGGGPPRIDRAPGTATDAATGEVANQPAPPLAAGGAPAEGAAPAAGTSAYGSAASAPAQEGEATPPSPSQ